MTGWLAQVFKNYWKKFPVQKEIFANFILGMSSIWAKLEKILNKRSVIWIHIKFLTHYCQTLTNVFCIKFLLHWLLVFISLNFSLIPVDFIFSCSFCHCTDYLSCYILTKTLDYMYCWVEIMWTMKKIHVFYEFIIKKQADLKKPFSW